MKRLVVVSNRVADLEGGAQSGGLAVALGDALKESRGLWFGWDGNIESASASQRIHLTQQENVRVATVSLSQEEYDHYYLGFSNKVLWPSFHYRLDLARFEPAFLDVYRDVNARFAKTLSGLLEPDDVIWIHDYHLIPLAAELRKLGVAHKIGFFLHIPFPSMETLQAVPEYQWLMKCLFAYDVVGFQTDNDTGNFARYVTEQAGGAMGEGGQLHLEGARVIARAFPIGIDADAFSAMARTPEADEQIVRLRMRTLASRLILGVDRLDYTKGLPNRMSAFRRLLELDPAKAKTVTFMQIAPPTREEVEAYSDIRQELEGLSGAINGEWGDFDWTPVRYIHRNVPRATLAALCRGSQIGLVTPLRDGINLVWKEYVAAQEADDPGVLVLSRFTGASEELKDAILVNPYDVDEVAKALDQAIQMSCDERRARHAALLHVVRANDVSHWRKAFLIALHEAPASHQAEE